MKRTMGTALVLAALAAPAAAQTNGYVLQCFSARASGQGCVTRGQPGIPSTLFDDPAGILAVGGSALELDVAPFAPVLHFENAANAEVRGARHVYPLPGVTYVAPRVGRLGWAVGLAPIGGFGADFKLQHPVLSGPDATPVDYESFFAAAKGGVVVAYELAPGLAVGGSVSGVYARIEQFRMPFSMPPAAAQGLAPLAGLDPAYPALFGQFTELTAYGDSEGYAGFGWSADLGVSYRSPAGVTVAASWRPRTVLTLDGGTAVMDLTQQFGQMMQALVAVRMQAYGETAAEAQGVVMGQLGAAGLDLSAGLSGTYAAATELALPMTAGVGVSFAPGRRWRLSAEAEWRQWSRAQETMPFDLTGGDNPNINLMLNGSPAAGDFSYPFPMQWKDTFTGKLGGEYALAGGHAVRGGYLYGQNPVPDNTVFATFPAITTHAASVGGTVRLGRLPLDLSLVHAFGQNGDGAAAHLVASEYAGSRTRLSETVLTVGTVWRF